MLRTHTARSTLGLAVLFLGTLLCLVLVARLDGPVSAFASSPLSPLPVLPSRQSSATAPALLWPQALGLGLVAVGAVLVVVGLVWLLRLC